MNKRDCLHVCPVCDTVRSHVPNCEPHRQHEPELCPKCRLGQRRNYGLELAETKAIDEYAFKKARLTLYAGDLNAIETVIAWLESADDFTESEFMGPDQFRELIRDMLMQDREARTYQMANNGPTTKGH